MLVSRGAGITEGLEIWYDPKTCKFFLVDKSPDGRFKADVVAWA